MNRSVIITSLCVGIALVLVVIFAVRHRQAAHTAQQASADTRADTVQQVEQPRQEIRQREQTVYPVTAKKLEQIATYRKELKKKELALKPVDRERIEYEVGQMDSNTLADSLRIDGYACAIMER